MSVEIEFPVEVMVHGVPLSLQASPASRADWKERIRLAARQELPEGHFATEEPIKVTIYYFTDTPAEFDIDNIVKPIFDSLNKFIYIDDRQVERLVVRKPRSTVQRAGRLGISHRLWRWIGRRADSAVNE